MNAHNLEDMSGRIQPRTASNLLLWGIAGFIVIFVLWASLTKLDRTVHGQGRIVPTAQLQVISNLEGGIVAQILAKAGQLVRKGDALVRLDRTLSSADLGTNQTMVNTLAVKMARLEAEINGTAPRFPVSTDPVIVEQIGIETSLYRSRKSDLAELTQAGEARIAQAQRAVAEADANRLASAASLGAAEEQASVLRPLVANGIEPRSNMIQADRAVAVGRSQVASAVAGLAKSRAGVLEARATLSQQRQQWRSLAADELTKIQGELSSRRTTLPALQDKLTRTEIRAPLSGRVNRVLVATVGGSVRPGEPLVEIVPSDSGLTIETAVRPSDIAFVRMGQRALVKITAYDYSIYGGLEGTVIGISPDAIVNERTGDSHYMVRVRATGKLADTNGRPLPVTSGMLADVNLIGEKRSVMSYILTPISRLSNEAFRE